MFDNSSDENDGIHVSKIVDALPCPTHGKDIGDPCWTIPTVRGLMRGICNSRARSAGATGQITPYERTSRSSSHSAKDSHR